MRVAYLGPAGTFSEDALREAGRGEAVEMRPAPTIYDAIIAVESGVAERALVPFENSTEGSVRTTLDTLALDTTSVVIVGEHDQPITNNLIARQPHSYEIPRVHLPAALSRGLHVGRLVVVELVASEYAQAQLGAAQGNVGHTGSLVVSIVHQEVVHDVHARRTAAAPSLPLPLTLPLPLPYFLR